MIDELVMFQRERAIARAAFLAGAQQTGEGWNAEYPCTDEFWTDMSSRFDEWFVSCLKFAPPEHADVNPQAPSGSDQ